MKSSCRQHANTKAASISNQTIITALFLRSNLSCMHIFAFGLENSARHENRFLVTCDAPTQPPGRCGKWPCHASLSCLLHNTLVHPLLLPFLRFPPVLTATCTAFRRRRYDRRPTNRPQTAADCRAGRHADWTDNATPPRRVPGPDSGWRRDRTGGSGGWWIGTWPLGRARRRGAVGSSAAAARTWGRPRAARWPRTGSSGVQPSGHPASLRL